jgi:hypothetical protein
MRRFHRFQASRSLALASALTLLGACADDPAVSGETGDGSSEDGGDEMTEETGDESNDDTSGGDGDGDGDPDPCAGDPCNDDDPCTIDSCDPSDGSCTNEEAVTNECRPIIEIEYPPRGATITGEGNDMNITILGSVNSMLGDITEFTLNGESVAVEADGSFSLPYSVEVGGNTLVFEAADSAENERMRVQSFLWGTGYLLPTEAKEGIAPQALGIWLSQQVIDDGDNSEPVNDLASILNLALGGMDLSSLLDTSGPITSEAGFDIYLTSLNMGSSSVALSSIDGGLHLSAAIYDVTGDLEFDCTNFSCELLGGDSTGGLSVSIITIDADLMMSVDENHELVVDVQNVSTGLDENDVDIWSNNGWTNFLVSIIEPLILGGAVADLQTELNNSLNSVLGPLVQEGLSALALSMDIELPSLADSTQTIPVSLITDFDEVDFHDGVEPPTPSPPQGGLFAERGGAYTPELISPWENDGIPNRDNCGLGDQGMDLPRSAPLELGLSDDLINQILFAGWRGGLLHFEVGEEILGGVDLSTFGVTDLELFASGMLAPTVSDCNADQTLYAHVGDLRIDGNLMMNGNPITFVSFTSMKAVMELGVSEEGLTIGISGVDVVDTELNIEEDEMIEAEGLLKGVLESALVDALEGALGGGGLGAIPLPQIDLSASLGLAPGSAVIEINAESASRGNGVTIVSGTL